MLVNAQEKDSLQESRRPKIGLSLSGGGAKGFAHVGVLKVIDSLGVKIDYVSGTSIGAIVGSLYASGYSGKEIEDIMMKTDFYNLLSNEKNRKEYTFFDKYVDKYIISLPISNKKITLPSSISTGQKNIYLLKEILKNVSNTNDFSKLPIPFLCIATNLESGKTKIFEEGDLVQSVMASSAFPSLLDPVKIGDSVYVDGSMAMSYPSKPLKDRGMDIVIGVNLNQGLGDKDNVKNVIDILNQIIDFGITKNIEEQFQYTDINIHPKLKEYGVTSFDSRKQIFDSGYEAALDYVEVFKKLPKREIENLRAPINPIYSNIYKIDSLIVENNKIYTEDYIKGKMRLKTPSVQTYGSINKMIDNLYATNNYKTINYDIIQENSKNILKLNVVEDQARAFLKFGLHYDNVFKTGVLLNLTTKRLLFKNSTLSTDIILGDKSRYYFNYIIDNGYIPGLGIYSSGMTFELKNNKGNMYEKWRWIRNDIFTQSTFRDRYAIGFGVSHDYYSSEDIAEKEINTNFINAFAFVKADTQDCRYFSTKGFLTNAEIKMIDLFSEEKKAVQINVDFKGNFKILKDLTYKLSAHYGMTINDVDPFYNYKLGGLFGQKLDNFIKFSGYEFGQVSDKNILVFSNNIQYNFYKNYYVIGEVSFADTFPNFEDFNFLKFNHTNLGISLGYKSPIGQIKVNYSHVLKENRGVFNVILGHWF